jgi:hypothetical protein
VKLRDGRPVKQVTLARLMARYGQIVDAEVSRPAAMARGA